MLLKASDSDRGVQSENFEYNERQCGEKYGTGIGIKTGTMPKKDKRVSVELPELARLS